MHKISRRRLLSGMTLTAAAAAAQWIPGASAARRTVADPTPEHTVALGRLNNYGPARVETKLREMAALCGGLEDVITPGDRVVIKPNLTGAGRATMPDGTSAIMSYTTHPDVVRAIGLLCLEAGAREVVMVEARTNECWDNNEYTGCIADLSATVLETNSPAPAVDYVSVRVPDHRVYDSVWMNDVIARADVLVSVAKLKCHANAGYTGVIKNLIGCLPTSQYVASPSDTYRTAIHTGDWSVRLPRIVTDVLAARPIDISVIDGIATMDQGEGPWNDAQEGIDVRCLQPEVLILGKNPVAVDAVGAAVMGFDPEAAHYAAPFLCGYNHLALAAEAGLGSNCLDDIAVMGESIADMTTPFTPCPAAGSSTPTPSPSPTASPTEQPTVAPTATPTGYALALPIVKK